MFKRARKELNKQSILTKDPHDIYDNEEHLEGLSSDSDGDIQSEEEEDSQTDSGTDEDEKDEGEEEGEEEDDREADGKEEEESDQGADDSEAEGGSSEDGNMIYKCKICPERVLQNEKMVELHLKSKQHKRRLRFVNKHSRTNEEVQKLKQKSEAKKQKFIIKKKEKLKQKRKEQKKRKWEREQLAKAVANGDSSFAGNDQVAKVIGKRQRGPPPCPSS